MRYYISCETFRDACVGANAFANHYSKNGVNLRKRRTEVMVGEDTFIFVNANDFHKLKGIHKNVIPYNTFIKKYFTQK